MGAHSQSIIVTPTGAALGADLHGVNLPGCPGTDALKTVHKALIDHLVVRIPCQQINDEELIRFSRYFGDLDERPEYQPTQGEPEYLRWITSISNIMENGRPIGGLGYGEAAWHTDMSYLKRPPVGSVLYAVETPPDGGSTWFANMYAAYDELDPGLKQQVESFTCVHDASHDSSGRLRSGFEEQTDPRLTPGVIHPLVRVHPLTGRSCLFLGRRRGASIPALDLAASEALLDTIWSHATQDKFVWRQHWRVGDVLMWDNRCVIHRRDAFDHRRRRLMRRTQLAGEPVHTREPYRT